MQKNKKMKVALLFSGQIRDLDPELFNRGLKLFCRRINAEIYLTFWDEPGISLNHKISNLKVKVDNHFDINSYIEKAFNGFKVKKISSESYDQWRTKLNVKYSKILSNDLYSKLTIHSLPQIYQIFKSFNLVSNIDQYDLIFRCRYDLQFVSDFSEKNFKRNTIYNLNFGNAFFPERIYDIFFWGTPKALKAVFNTWQNIPELVNDAFDNNLDKRDPCRLLYLSAINANNNVKSGKIRYCDIFRPPKKTYYEYLVSILHWNLNDQDLKDKIFVRKSFFINARTELGSVKCAFLFLLTSMRIHRKATLGYWKNKFFQILISLLSKLKRYRKGI
jgi:hypothetical protein